MNPTDETANQVWVRTLPLVRKARHRRRRRRIMLAGISACALVCCPWLAWRQSPGAPSGLPIGLPPGERGTAAFVPPVSEIQETIAVMRVDEEGRMRLEELPVGEFGSVELVFGLTQLVSDDLPD
ncbi:hypothetical protein JIN84_04605 [Luteolibacter yonseiensis]|uniref:Uncharacterized protein n=1 Tax=Luteolibacter yonseiensis TaxID=1144680 RepID=A0A934V988_9BACT|nr:hypothetical protein [Luteolibacter yonseiensis]MBK1814883.1 hypothetical protein [Luteolibacter yonseiensis]